VQAPQTARLAAPTSFLTIITIPTHCPTTALADKKRPRSTHDRAPHSKWHAHDPNTLLMCLCAYTCVCTLIPSQTAMVEASAPPPHRIFTTTQHHLSPPSSVCVCKCVSVWSTTELSTYLFLPRGVEGAVRRRGISLHRLVDPAIYIHPEALLLAPRRIHLVHGM
jgi:hypothetical protein